MRIFQITIVVLISALGGCASLGSAAAQSSSSRYASTFDRLKSQVAQARGTTLLILAEDADGDTIPRGSRISTRILNALVTQFDSHGYDVYDETALTYRTHTQGRSRRTDAELIDIARSIRRPPIDVTVFFQVYSSVARKSYQNELRLRSVGRILNVQDGRRLGNWEAKLPEDRDQVWLLPSRCFSEGNDVSRECILETVGDEARILAQELGAVIVEILDGQHARRGERHRVPEHPLGAVQVRCGTRAGGVSVRGRGAM